MSDFSVETILDLAANLPFPTEDGSLPEEICAGCFARSCEVHPVDGIEHLRARLYAEYLEDLSVRPLPVDEAVLKRIDEKFFLLLLAEYGPDHPWVAPFLRERRG